MKLAAILVLALLLAGCVTPPKRHHRTYYYHDPVGMAYAGALLLNSQRRTNLPPPRGPQYFQISNGRRYYHGTIY